MARSTMNFPRRLYIVATILALALALTACGGASSDPAPASRAGGSEEAVAANGVRGPGGYLKTDGDPDADDRSTKPSNDDELEMGRAARSGASAADRAAVTAVVKRYYTAAAAGDGAAGCTMLFASLAAAIAAEAPGAYKGSCAAALSRQFAREHQHLAGEQVGSMIVTGVHVSGAVGYATLGFQHAIEAEVILQREAGGWKLNSLFDSPLP